MEDESRRRVLPKAEAGSRVAILNAWLSSIAGVRSLPSFEVDGFTLDTLEAIMLANKQADNKANVYAAGIMKLASEYDVEADRLSALLDAVGWHPDAYESSIGWQRVLGELASILQLTTVSDAGYVVALAELTAERQRLTQRHATEVARLASLEKAAAGAAVRRAAAEALQQRLREAAAGQREAVAEQRANTKFLCDKAGKYKASVTALERRLAVCGGADPTVRHEHLMARASRLADINAQLEGVRARLAAYRDLPADSELARAKVEHVRSQLAKLEAELSQQIDLMRL